MQRSYSKGSISVGLQRSRPIRGRGSTNFVGRTLRPWASFTILTRLLLPGRPPLPPAPTTREACPVYPGPFRVRPEVSHVDRGVVWRFLIGVHPCWRKWRQRIAIRENGCFEIDLHNRSNRAIANPVLHSFPSAERT